MYEFKSFLGPKPEGVLYHYTSQATLFSIVTNRSIWASHISYMNDSNEIRYAANKTKLLIAGMINNYDGEKAKLLNQLSTWLDQYINPQHFIFSFSLSEKGNLLSQWRAYTPINAGVSIGFNQRDLEKYCNDNDLMLVQCIYDLAEQDNVLASVINKVLHKFDSDFQNIKENTGPSTQEYHPFLNTFTELFLYDFSKIKDPLFFEEREWRLLSRHYESYTHNDIKFRAGKTTLIPYVQFPLDNFRQDELLFEQIYVGPSSNFQISFPAVSAFLGNKKACNNIYNSMQKIREI